MSRQNGAQASADVAFTAVPRTCHEQQHEHELEASMAGNGAYRNASGTRERTSGLQ